MTRLGVIDQIVREPVGGAHRDPKASIRAVGDAIAAAFAALHNMDRDAIRATARINSSRLAVSEPSSAGAPVNHD